MTVGESGGGEGVSSVSVLGGYGGWWCPDQRETGKSGEGGGSGQGGGTDAEFCMSQTESEGLWDPDGEGEGLEVGEGSELSNGCRNQRRDGDHPGVGMWRGDNQWH